MKTLENSEAFHFYFLGALHISSPSIRESISNIGIEINGKLQVTFLVWMGGLPLLSVINGNK